MSTIHHKAVEGVAAPATVQQVERPSSFAYRALAVLRIAFGLTFLWAFFDKLLALGFSTGRADGGTVDRFGDAAWVNGGSPTEGFLKFGADGPFKGFYNSIAGSAWADVLFMVGLLAIGLVLVLGIGMRIGTLAGALLYVMMWTVALPPDTNPVLDDHILGAITMIVLLGFHAGNVWGLGDRWASMDLVKRFQILR
jgi:thiosulfate dehydrogenase [quinone] large subunit